MNEHCECSGPGFCTRHKMTKGHERFLRCKGLSTISDCGLSSWNAWERGLLGATAPEAPQLNPTPFCSENKTPPPPVIEKGETKGIVCGEIPEFSCFRFFSEINNMYEGVVRGNLTKDGNRKIVATKGFENHIRLFIEQWKESLPKVNEVPIPTWSIGVTAVPIRMDLLSRTLASLRAGGFENAVVFFDSPVVPVPCDITDHHEVIFRGSNIRAYGHWLLSLLELYVRNPTADRFAVFQDDVLCYKNTRHYLDKVVLTNKVFWNLYTGTFSIQSGNVSNEQIIQSADIGFVESNQRGHGAQGYVFPNQAVSDLFKSPDMFMRMWDERRRHCSIDGFVVHSLKNQGWKEHIHAPSLLQHIGQSSAMGHGAQPLAKSFLGEEFDATSFLQSSEDVVNFGLGTLIGKALKLFGIDDNLVTTWLGRPCGCAERRKKLDELTAWARRSLFRGFVNAKQSLIDLLSGE